MKYRTQPTNQSDDDGTYAFWLAQTSRLVRFCTAWGVDPGQVLNGETTFDLTPILNEQGKIVPEPQDFAPWTEPELTTDRTELRHLPERGRQHV